MDRTKEKFVTVTLFKKEIANIHGELKKCATKDDLKALPTKKDFESLAGAQLRNDVELMRIKETMATKDDIGRLSNVMVRNHAEFLAFKEIAATKSDLHVLKDQMDHVIGLIKDFGRKSYVHDDRFNRLEPQVAAHELRITALENKGTASHP